LSLASEKTIRGRKGDLHNKPPPSLLVWRNIVIFEFDLALQGSVVDVFGSDAKWWFRAGGLSAIVIGISYLLIVALYVSVGGAIPSGAEEKLEFFAEHTTEWWAIIALSVLTNFLYLPVALSLYLALKEINKNAMLVGAGLIGLFTILENTVSWPSLASLVTLSGDYSTATDGAQRAAIVAAASYASSLSGSTLLAVYAILVPALGKLIIGLVMRKGIFSKITAYLAVVAGIIGIVSVVGPFIMDALRSAVVISSVLITVWLLLVGYRLYRLGQRDDPHVGSVMNETKTKSA